MARPYPHRYTMAMSTGAAATPVGAEPDTTPPPSGAPVSGARKPITLRTIQRMAALGEKFAALTAYDATTARWLEEAGVPILLAGDSAAEVVLGLPTTIHAPLEFMITITAAVKRGAPLTHVMADMPFMSYQADDAEGIRNAGRFMTEGTADSVKIEADRRYVPLVQQMARAGIPVVAHIGCRPQEMKRIGGYKIAGRSANEAREVIADAVALEEAGACMLLIEAVPAEVAGACMLLIEAVPAEVAERIVQKTRVPTIGCGAGPACHGQVVVLHDLLGLSPRQPSFARPIMAMGQQLIDAARTWVEKVRDSDLGDHPYRMNDGEADRI